MIVAALLVRNEADRYLTEVLHSLRPLVDTILVLDDGSTDGSVRLCESLGAIVRHRKGAAMWGQESSARKELWDWATEVAGEGWVLIADADQVLVAEPQAFRALCTSWEVTAWGIPLYDCWDARTQFRADGFWQGYQVARPWLFRADACPSPEWNPRGIHCGHAPCNFPLLMGVVPEGMFWKHLGWLAPADREAKYTRYLSTASDLSPFERAHLESVLETA